MRISDWSSDVCSSDLLDADNDTLFGLADLGLGCPELGSFSLDEIAALRLPFGLFIERDLFFDSAVPVSIWAETARRTGSIAQAEMILCRAPSRGDQLPPAPPTGVAGCRAARSLRRREPVPSHCPNKIGGGIVGEKMSLHE